VSVSKASSAVLWRARNIRCRHIDSLSLKTVKILARTQQAVLDFVRAPWHATWQNSHRYFANQNVSPRRE
jgi:hypothetical protein